MNSGGMEILRKKSKRRKEIRAKIRRTKTISWHGEKLKKSKSVHTELHIEDSNVLTKDNEIMTKWKE